MNRIEINKEVSLPQIETYKENGRPFFEELYLAYSRLKEEYGWEWKIFHWQEVIDDKGNPLEGAEPLPILALWTPDAGEAIWVVAGIHGEEPAGPTAIAENIDFLGELGEKVPIVTIPFNNPRGYRINWRYPNEPRDLEKGKSVGDSEHYLLDPKRPHLPRRSEPICPEAQALTAKVLELARTHPPKLSINLHEDESLSGPYIYSQGELGAEDPVAQMIVQILIKSGINLQMSGSTRRGEPIENGIVASEIHDGSLDELLATEKIFLNGKVVEKIPATSVIVVETPTKLIPSDEPTPLEKRVAAHREIILSLEEFWQVLQAS